MKSLTFQFEDALLSAEGLSILAGADLIPARNKHLPGASPEARSVISHYTEKYSVITNNIQDLDTNNILADDLALKPAQGAGDYSPRGGLRNIWLTRKPYVGQNASIYVMLLDSAGEVSGAPLEINLNNEDPGTMAPDVNGDQEKSYLSKFMKGVDAGTGGTASITPDANCAFIAFDKNNTPMPKQSVAGKPQIGYYPDPTNTNEQGVFDDMVMAYVDVASAIANWTDAWGAVPTLPTTAAAVAASEYVRVIQTGAAQSGGWDFATSGLYGYLVAPSGGVGQPKAFKEGTQIVYKLNVPSILYQDIVLLDYYVEYQHDAVQVSVLPDKFGPYMYIEGNSLVRRASDGMDLPIEFVIPKFKVTTALTFTLQSTGDPSTFNFQGDAYPDFSKFDLTRKVLADILILDADDNSDGAAGDAGQADPTSYRRFQYNEDSDSSYLWKDPSLEPHGNLDYSDTQDYIPTHGGPATKTAGLGLIDSAPGTAATPNAPSFPKTTPTTPPGTP